MSEKPRQNTCDLLQLIDEGYLTHEIVLQSALNWMSDDEVGEMALCEGFFMEEEDYEEMDGDVKVKVMKVDSGDMRGVMDEILGHGSPKISSY